ncbi:GntR family transcriptional regulator [Alphaproteobacteria bacterium]|nr:GntR family transcriptional regulator [Alphaproteobacteria bacterium]
MKSENRLTDQVAAALAGQILSEKWAPGQKLPSDAVLCETHGVSRTVLREALRVLGAKGLISARPRVGTCVAATDSWSLWDPDVLHWLDAASPSPETLTPLLHHAKDMRLALEPALAALASSRASQAEKQALQQSLRDLQNNADCAHEQAFLQCLYAISGNSFAAYACHMACWALAHRQTPPPLSGYGALTAAISQGAGVEARQSAMTYLIGQ